MKKIKVTVFPTHFNENPYLAIFCKKLQTTGVIAQNDAQFTIKWLLYNKANVKILHFHWIHMYSEAKNDVKAFIKLIGFYTKLRIATFLGYKIVWTVHNIMPHETYHKALQCWIRKKLANIAHVVTHCEYSKNVIEQKFKKRHVDVIMHGNYVEKYPNVVSKSIAREYLRLPQDSKIYLCFGLIRKYKGIEELMLSFNKFKIDKKLLMIVGKPLCDVLNNIYKYVEKCNYIKVVPHYIPDEEVQYYFNAADFVILPYKRIMSSGTVLLAMSFAKPLIVPKIGCIPEIIDKSGAIFYEPNKKDGILEALYKSLNVDADKMGQNSYKKVISFNWHTVAKKYTELYHKIVKTT